MGDRFKNGGKIGACDHMVKVPADRALQFPELPELLIVILCLIDLKFHQFMNIVSVPGSFGASDLQLEIIEMIVDVIDKVIQVTGR